MLANLQLSYVSQVPNQLASTLMFQAETKLRLVEQALTSKPVSSYPSMLPLVYQLRLNSKSSCFPGVGGWWLGGVKLKLKLNSAQLELELGLSLAKINEYRKL
jgi:hypothetical protein